MLHVDKDLFAAAQAGDRVALERLLSQLRPDIQRYAVSVLCVVIH